MNNLILIFITAKWLMTTILILHQITNCHQQYIHFKQLKSITNIMEESGKALYGTEKSQKWFVRDWLGFYVLTCFHCCYIGGTGVCNLLSTSFKYLQCPCIQQEYAFKRHLHTTRSILTRSTHLHNIQRKPWLHIII